MKKIELDCAVVERFENGIIQIGYRDDYVVELQDVVEVDKLFMTISGGSEVLYVLMDTKGKFNTFTPDAQKFLSKETELVKNGLLGGFAMVIDSLAYRMAAKFYLKFYRPNYKLKLFSTEQKAMDWLDLRRINELQNH